MSKMIFAFILMFLGFAFGIKIFGSLSKSEKMGLTKLVAYSIVCSVMTMVVVAGIVILF